ncbi:hypothetical protein BC936DRAFT_138477 [Jimgerdemannia flammicorona]|uniref:Arrestin-like N-terminal domain-containing protein n=1 Tax=Jimgerdemannia flammicorona TaxID=994334 RepID=A0A433CCB8_9FUNG|nr:hypothetical protein BC936DRAFT_138477 [Jimgerdemannia flammicorona]
MKDVFSFEIIPVETDIEFFGTENDKQKHTLKGDLKIILAKPVKVKSLYVKFKGETRVALTVARPDSSEAPDATASFAKVKSVLAEKVSFPAGVNVLTWQLDIPASFPRSSISAHGTIEYKVEATLCFSSALSKNIVANKNITLRRHLMPSRELAPYANTQLVKGNVIGLVHYEVEVPKIVCVEQKTLDFSVKLLPFYPEGNVKWIKMELLQMETYRLTFIPSTSNTKELHHRGKAKGKDAGPHAAGNPAKVITRSLPAVTIPIDESRPSSWTHPLVLRQRLTRELAPSLESPLIDITHGLHVTIGFVSPREKTTLKFPVLISSVPAGNVGIRSPTASIKRYHFDTGSVYEPSFHDPQMEEPPSIPLRPSVSAGTSIVLTPSGYNPSVNSSSLSSTRTIRRFASAQDMRHRRKSSLPVLLLDITRANANQLRPHQVHRSASAQQLNSMYSSDTLPTYDRITSLSGGFSTPSTRPVTEYSTIETESQPTSPFLQSRPPTPIHNYNANLPASTVLRGPERLQIRPEEQLAVAPTAKATACPPSPSRASSELDPEDFKALVDEQLNDAGKVDDEVLDPYMSSRRYRISHWHAEDDEVIDPMPPIWEQGQDRFDMVRGGGLRRYYSHVEDSETDETDDRSSSRTASSSRLSSHFSFLDYDPNARKTDTPLPQLPRLSFGAPFGFKMTLNNAE